MITNNKPSNSMDQETKRKLELIQLETRYKSTYQIIKEDDKETVVRLAIKPTDPDFPFELDSLQIQIYIPKDYPSTKCRIQVLNSDIPKGFAINLEKGYSAQVENSSAHQTLVRQMNWLDRNMENLLQQAPAPTVRFISHMKTDHAAAAEPQQERYQSDSVTTKPLSHQSSVVNLSKQPEPVAISSKQPSVPTKQPSASSSEQILSYSKQPLASSSKPTAVSTLDQEEEKAAKYTEEEKSNASKRRKREIKQLQTRFCDSFKTVRSNKDETTVVLTLEVNDVDFTHEQKLGGKQLNIKYHIPTLYPLETCTIDIENRNIDDTRKSWIQEGFAAHVQDKDNSLFENLNWLNRYLEFLISVPPAKIKTQEEVETDKMAAAQQKVLKPPTTQQKKSMLSVSAPMFVPQQGQKKKMLLFDEEDSVKRNKVIIVNDPSYIVDDQDESSEEESDEEETTSSEEEGESSEHKLVGISQPPKIKRGTDVRLVDPVLDNVSLFRCSVLHVIVKCARCKNTTDIENIKPEQDDAVAGSSKTKTERWISCPTCSSIMGVKFFAEFVHQGMKSLGLLQLAGCSAYDILPSSYIGTCGQCMTDMTSPIRLSPHDTPHTVGCFSCHTKMTFGLGEYRFVKIGTEGGERLTADESQVMKLKKKKKREEALVIGEPLPDQGTCSHYRKSKHWFRFPCCHKLYPCDICHDSNEDHSYELARRHVCGMCSREQAIVIGKPCSCGHEFEKAIHKGAFWEGGKGVRNKDVMSRKDPRKYKGVGKTVSKKQDRVGTSGKERRQSD